MGSGVEKSHFPYDKAEDQYVGRVVCGLSAHSPMFATLPPFFEVGPRDPLAYTRDEVDLELGETKLNVCYRTYFLLVSRGLSG